MNVEKIISVRIPIRFSTSYTDRKPTNYLETMMQQKGVPESWLRYPDKVLGSDLQYKTDSYSTKQVA